MKLEFHHINFVSKDVDKMDKFYKKILNMKGIPLENFPRTKETDDSGYAAIVTDGVTDHVAVTCVQSIKTAEGQCCGPSRILRRTKGDQRCCAERALVPSLNDRRDQAWPIALIFSSCPSVFGGWAGSVSGFKWFWASLS